jgi:hypothetical protein
MFTQVGALRADLRTLFQYSQHLHSSESRMAWLLLGTCPIAFPGAYIPSNLQQEPDN